MTTTDTPTDHFTPKKIALATTIALLVCGGLLALTFVPHHSGPSAQADSGDRAYVHNVLVACAEGNPDLIGPDSHGVSGDVADGIEDEGQSGNEFVYHYWLMGQEPIPQGTEIQTATEPRPYFIAEVNQDTLKVRCDVAPWDT